MNRETIFVLISSLICIGFGWFLNETSQWFRLRKEDKKKLKQVLYSLLETFYLFTLSHPEYYKDVIDSVSRKVIGMFPKEIQTEEIKNYLDSFYFDILKEVLEPVWINRLPEIKNNYQLSINELSNIDPILAYQISGNTSIFEYFKEMETLLKEFKGFLGKNKTSSNVVQLLTDKVESTLFNETINDLENDIRKIAWKINPVVWYNSQKTIKYRKETIKKESKEKSDKFFNEIVKSIKANSNCA